MSEDLTKHVKGGRKAFFEHPEIDSLLTMLLALLAEHSALRERLVVLENRLQEKGVVDSLEARVDQIDPALQDAMAGERMRLIKTVLEAGINIDTRKASGD